MDQQLHVALAVVKYFEFGGLQRDFRRIAEALVARGHQVTTFASTWEGPEIAGTKQVILPVSSSSNHGRNAAFGAEFRQAVSAGNFDLTLGFNKFAGLDYYYAGDPCFLARMKKNKGIFFPLLRMLPRYQSYLRAEAAVFGPDSETKALLIAAGEKAKFQTHYQTAEERFQVLPPGIDRERLDRGMANKDFDRDKLVSSLGLDPKDGLILTVGSGFDTKGVDRVIRSLAIMPVIDERYFSYVVVGEGKTDRFEALSKKHGISARVVFAGPRQDVVDFYRAADLLAHPARTENTGTTLLEAMYCGLPVLTTANCGYAYHVLAGNGGLVAPEPFLQGNLDRFMLEALLSPARPDWRKAGAAYCQIQDLYGLPDRVCEILETHHRTSLDQQQS